MTTTQPTASVHLEIPDCRMEASLGVDRMITFELGWPRDTALLLFTCPEALQRFVNVATGILAASSSNTDPTNATTALVSAPASS